MTSREQLSAILDQLLLDMNQYLNKINYRVIPVVDDSKKDAVDRTIINERSRNYGEYLNADKNYYVCVYNEYFHNRELTAKRVANILDVKNSLLTMLDDLPNKRNISLDDVNTAVGDLKNLLQTAIEKNQILSRKNNKDHQSYQQCRQSGMNAIQAMWNKTAVSSRANTALENASKHIDHFHEKLNVRPELRRGRCV